MLLIYPMSKPMLWGVVLALQVIMYFGVLRKMGLPAWNAVVPCLAEWRLSTVLFRWRRSFWRPSVVAGILSAAAFYLNPYVGTAKVTARLLLLAAVLVYCAMLLRLYVRLSKAFGKGIIFALMMFMVPPLGLAILGYGKSKYPGHPQLKPRPQHGRLVTFLLRSVFVLVSAAEVLVLLAGVGLITIRTRRPRLLNEYLLSTTYDSTKDVVGTGTVVTREDSMGEDYAKLASMPTSRDRFFPDHSKDESCVVLGYFIGSDLEDAAGLASANITQMIDATKRGSGITFVLECGGSGRWFTKGVKDNTYGRYVIRDGKLEKVQDLPGNTCMSTPEAYADFLNWARDAYPADRRMLVMWDHGGGFGLGYGADVLNEREGDYPMLLVSEMAEAIEQSGMKFDVIGFDACLMQDIEIAVAFEPYADWYIASEEVEGGYGWPYTSAFGMLAENPGMPSEDFGRELIACYDPYNTIINSDEPDTTATLSLVDLTRVRPAYEQLEPLFKKSRDAIREDSSSYAALSLSGTKSYTFYNNEQVDLVDFLTRYEALDFEDKVFAQEELDEMLDAVRACVVYRNGDSAEGINGIALTFPCASIGSYGYDHHQLDNFKLDTQKALYDDFFSIMAAQRVKNMEAAAEAGDIWGVITSFGDYTSEDWYVEGFEDYETQDALVDIPLAEVEDGYEIQLPEKAWDIIADSQVIVYQKDSDGLMRYLGIDSIGSTDAKGHPMLAMGDTWVHVGGQLVCYEANGSRETEEGVVFTGTTKAILNGTDEILLHIEWDPVAEGEDAPAAGRITSYDMLNDDNPLFGLLSDDVAIAISSKAQRTFDPGDRIEFLFDYYDEQGQLVKTETYGNPVVVTSMERLEVGDKAMGECDIVFGGVLTDVYQRTMTTEKIEAHVS